MRQIRDWLAEGSQIRTLRRLRRAPLGASTKRKLGQGVAGEARDWLAGANRAMCVCTRRRSGTAWRAHGRKMNWTNISPDRGSSYAGPTGTGPALADVVRRGTAAPALWRTAHWSARLPLTGKRRGRIEARHPPPASPDRRQSVPAASDGGIRQDPVESQRSAHPQMAWNGSSRDRAGGRLPLSRPTLPLASPSPPSRRALGLPALSGRTHEAETPA
jgi:hypothetical protein